MPSRAGRFSFQRCHYRSTRRWKRRQTHAVHNPYTLQAQRTHNAHTQTHNRRARHAAKRRLVTCAHTTGTQHTAHGAVRAARAGAAQCCTADKMPRGKNWPTWARTAAFQVTSSSWLCANVHLAARPHWPLVKCVQSLNVVGPCMFALCSAFVGTGRADPSAPCKSHMRWAQLSSPHAVPGPLPSS